MDNPLDIPHGESLAIHSTSMPYVGSFSAQTFSAWLHHMLSLLLPLTPHSLQHSERECHCLLEVLRQRGSHRVSSFSTSVHESFDRAILRMFADRCCSGSSDDFARASSQLHLLWFFSLLLHSSAEASRPLSVSVNMFDI